MDFWNAISNSLPSTLLFLQVHLFVYELLKDIIEFKYSETSYSKIMNIPDLDRVQLSYENTHTITITFNYWLLPRCAYVMKLMA